MNHSDTFDSSTLNEKEDQSKEPISLPDALQDEIDHWLAKYPTNQRQSAIVPVLLVAQRYYDGWLPQSVIDTIANYIRMPKIAAYEVATFYSMLELNPIGKNKINICTNISCMLNGCDQLVTHLQKRLKIKLGETTQDQHVTLKEVECLGACTRAPVMSVNGRYHENVTPESIDDILEKLKDNSS